MTLRVSFSALAAVAASLQVGAAFAQALPDGTMKHDAASKGVTDVAGYEGFEAAPKAAGDAKDTTEAQIQAGALLATGNSRSLAATAAGHFRLRRGPDQGSSDAAVNYARAGASGEPQETSVENYQAKVRYDRFLAGRFAVFLAATVRRDRFQGLDLRLNLDPGAAYYFVDAPSHQLWGEFGYDFQYDLPNQEALDAAVALGEPIDESEVRHSARAFVGYTNTINEAVAFTTGLEYLQGLGDVEQFRLNWDAGLTSKLGGSFSLATTFSLKYDHAPLPGVEDLDTSTAVSLVYQLL